MIPTWLKRKVDTATFEELLRMTRFASMSDPINASDEAEGYFTDRFESERAKLSADEFNEISNRVGF